VPAAIYRLRLPDGTVRLARGDIETGPAELVASDRSLDAALAGNGAGLADLLTGPGDGPVLARATVLAPVESQEIWAAGVTYLRSRDARMEESEASASVYDRVYEADRPELFFKSPGWRARGPGDPIGIRRDSTWDVPEPEVALVLAGDNAIVGYVIGNDVSSRSIEGENPLYLPQAKFYDGSCALGPAIVLAGSVTPPFRLELEIVREAVTIFTGQSSTDEMRRGFEELARSLGSALSFPVGAILMTGTSIVPPPPFTLLAGDIVRISISGLGVLENVVEAVGSA
jgi:2-dehydro-3-deoxy-D-arabinonate dehydratase